MMGTVGSIGSQMMPANDPLANEPMIHQAMPQLMMMLKNSMSMEQRHEILELLKLHPDLMAVLMK